MGNIFKTGAKINLGIIIIPFVVGAVGSIIGLKLLELSCKTHPWKQFYSPDKEWKLVLSKSDCGLIDEIDIEGAICRVGQHKIISEIDGINKCSDDTIFLFYMTDSNDLQVNADDLIHVNWEDNNNISVH